jgi:hypothetical protein
VRAWKGVTWEGVLKKVMAPDLIPLTFLPLFLLPSLPPSPPTYLHPSLPQAWWRSLPSQENARLTTLPRGVSVTRP